MLIAQNETENLNNVKKRRQIILVEPQLLAINFQLN